MPHKLGLILLLFAVSHCPSLFAEEPKRLLSYTHNDIEYKFLISIDRAEKLPQWSWRTETIPISISNALKIAEQAFTGKYSDVKAVHLREIEIHSLGLEGTKKDIWTYQVWFSPLRNGNWDNRGFNMVIVLFDGSVIFHE